MMKEESMDGEETDISSLISEPVTVERSFVQDVYDIIGSHFSETRYKPWPKVVSFIGALKPGSLIADVGCGNGKYMALRDDLVVLGSDRSFSLARIASERGLELLVADNLCLPYTTACFDAVLSVAVIHHFASDERRCMALQELARIIRPNGVALIYVWAYEQKNKHGEARFKDQDVMIPWHLQKRFKEATPSSTSSTSASTETQTQISTIASERGVQTVGKNGEIRFNRYYHVFREGELESLVESIPDHPFEIMERGYEHDNWYVIVKRVNSHHGE